MVAPSLIQKNDQSLVAEYLRDRDEASFRELYRRHTPALYGLAVRFCGSDSDAHDAIQETWIRACRALPTFQWQSTLRTWLTGVLINCAREQSRKRTHDNTDTLPDELMATISIPGERLNLEQAVSRLPDGYRHVLMLHDVEGYTHEEISDLLGVSIGTSKSQLHHARKAIRTALRTE